METLIYGSDRTAEAGAVIASGGLVAFPTETVYGLGANAFNEAAVRRIFEAKGRPQDNPLIVHIAHMETLGELCREIPEAAAVLAEKFWPGPLTMVLPKHDVVPDAVSAGLDTVAVRFPSHKLARDLIKSAGVPIAAPSANRSGSPSPTCFDHAFADLDGRIDGIIKDEEPEIGLESTVVEFSCAKVRLLRPGFITPEDIEAVLGEGTVEIDPGVMSLVGEGEIPRSPGMKHRHYAPRSPVIAVTGDNVDCAREIRRAVRGIKGAAAIVCDEYAGLVPCETVTLGAYGDYAAQAHRLFDALRALDRADVKIIYAQCPPERGIGLAVANRLKRAAGFNIIEARRLTVIGLTGPTGAGKGVACAQFRAYGAEIVDCDALYHEMLASDGDMLAEIAEIFPGAIRDGKLIRRELGKIVFGDPVKLRALEAAVFPHIKKRIAVILKDFESRATRYAVLDAPTLFESGADSFCDITLGVTAPRNERIRRIIERDGLDEEYAALRADAGQDDDFYREKCDYTLVNNSAPREFAAAAREIFYKIKNLEGTKDGR